MNRAKHSTVQSGFARASLVVALIALSYAPLHADEDDDFMEMSLAELLEIEILRREPLGIHHTHEQGEFMFSVSHMHMSMSGNRDGTDAMSTAEVHANFMVAPKDMSTDMIMTRRNIAPVVFIRSTTGSDNFIKQTL